MLAVGFPLLLAQTSEQQLESDNRGVTFQSLVDALFPRERPAGTRFSLSLRNFSNVRYETESDIRINEDSSGNFRVIQYYLPSGSESLDEQWGEARDDKDFDRRRDIREIAKRFKVEVRAVDVPQEKLQQLISGLDKLPFPTLEFPATSESGRPVVEIVTDAQVFDLQYWSLNGEVDFRYACCPTRRDPGRLTYEWLARLKELIDGSPTANRKPDGTIDPEAGHSLNGIAFVDVYYSTGEHITAVKISVTNSDGRQLQEDVPADRAGAYIVSNLAPGKYTINIDSTAPQIHQTRNVTIASAKVSWVDVKVDR